jgi:hypothetical protein
MLFFTQFCPDAMRTLAALQHNDVAKKFEDADSEGEDHAPDGIRYGCMSRPRKMPDPGRVFTTPGGEQGEVTRAWAFSIDGHLNGQAIRGALFAGECMVVQAMTQEVAERVAKDGLAETIRLLREEYDARPITEPNIGILTDTGGRKGRGDGTLHSDPKLKAMIEHIIGGKPWKW